MLHNVIHDAKNKHMPSKLVKYNKYKHEKSKCVAYGIIRSIQYRDDLCKTFKMADPISNEFATTKINLNTYNKILKNLIRLAKQFYYETIFAKLKNDTKATWKPINKILNRTKRKKIIHFIFHRWE